MLTHSEIIAEYIIGFLGIWLKSEEAFKSSDLSVDPSWKNIQKLI